MEEDDNDDDDDDDELQNARFNDEYSHVLSLLLHASTAIPPGNKPFYPLNKTPQSVPYQK